MTRITKAGPKHQLPAALASGFIVACLGLGAIAVSATAEEHRGGDRHGGGYRGENHGRGGWGGGYYPAPPVVYGSPYGYRYGGYPYGYPPPVVYGPGVGISLPGVSVGIH